MTTSTAERVKKHRDALRAAGLRPVQIWVPDTRSPAFAAECRRQSLIVAQATAQESETLLRLEQVADKSPIPRAGAEPRPRRLA